MSNKKKVIKVAAGSVAALGAIGGAATGIALTVDKHHSQEENANDILSGNRGGQQQTTTITTSDRVASNNLTALPAVLDVTLPDFAESLPPFVDNLARNVLENLFSVRVETLSECLNENITDVSTIRNRIAAESFKEIYNLELQVKYGNNDGDVFSITLGSLLNNLVGEDKQSENLLLGLLKGESPALLIMPLTNYFQKADPEHGRDAMKLITEQAYKLLESTTKADGYVPVEGEEAPVVDNGIMSGITGVLPQNISAAFSTTTGLQLHGLLGYIGNRIIPGISQIDALQGLELSEIAQNQEYRNLTARLLSYSWSISMLDSQYMNNFANNPTILQGMNAMFSVYKGDVTSESFTKIIALDNLLKSAGQMESLQINNVIKLDEGQTWQSKLDTITSSLINITAIDIPEISFGRGAEYLTPEQNNLLAKLAVMLGSESSSLTSLLGMTSPETQEAAKVVGSTLSLLFMPNKDGKYFVPDTVSMDLKGGLPAFIDEQYNNVFSFAHANNFGMTWSLVKDKLIGAVTDNNPTVLNLVYQQLGPTWNKQVSTIMLINVLVPIAEQLGFM